MRVLSIHLNNRLHLSGFTLLETLITAGLVSVGFAVSLAVLTNVNGVASTARNATGAFTVAQNKIDAILSAGPFNPQKTNADGSKQIPPELVLDSTRGGPAVENNVPIYKEPIKETVQGATWTYANEAARLAATGFTTSQKGKYAYQSSNNSFWRLTSAQPPLWSEIKPNVIVLGKVTTSVKDVSKTYYGITMHMYAATVTVEYNYRNRKYSYSMNTVRTSDI